MHFHIAFDRVQCWGRGLLRSLVVTSLVTLTADLAFGAAPPITYYLSEGATGGFFDEDVLIANPTDTDAPVTLTFSKENGEQVVTTQTVAARARVTVHVDKISGMEATAASAQVRSDSGVPLIVERSMFWDQSYYAGATGSSVEQPAQDWFFAEGSQGFFQTFLLVINPNASPTDVTFTFFRENEPTVTKSVTVGASTRLTLDAGSVPDLVNRSFGIAVHATQPIMAERSMYFGTTATRLWSGGTESAGVTAPSTHWFLAEGATGGFFDTFILLSNPNNTAANVTLQYLLDTGETITVPKTIAPNARLTTNIEAEADVRLHNAAVSTVVTSDVPVIAERSMYWPGAAIPWGEGHNSFGVVDAGTTWGLSEGRTGGPLSFHTYILLANPQTTAANVTVSFLRENGAAPVTKTYTVPATSRFNIDTGGVSQLHAESFGAIIKVTNGVPIIVERSMYWDSNGFQFSGGTNATGIRLPDSVTTPTPPSAQITITGISGAQSFSPNPASASPGQTITWKDTDGITHHIVADDGSFDTGTIGGGATSAPITVGNSSVSYHCSIHPSMTGTITVSAGAASTCGGSACK
jgi:plastocyanin